MPMKTPAQNLAGKRVIVTGSSMGIGQAVAIKLAEEGAKIVINARGQKALGETIDAVTAVGGEAVACCGPADDYHFAGELLSCCLDNYGGIDGLINCAGIAEPQGSSILDIPASDWRALIDVHLHGTFNTCRQVAPIMAKQKRGTIVNTSSHAFLGMYGGTGYAAGKGATNSLSLSMAMDLKEYGVSVNAICPGAKTRLSTGDDYQALITDLNKRGLLEDNLMEASLNPPHPSYVAPLYAFLSSDRAKAISGRLFWAAGGYVGLFHRNSDQLLGFKNHETNKPWTLEELDSKLKSQQLRQHEELYNVVLNAGPGRLLVKQKLLLKIADTRLVQWLMSLNDRPSNG
jgi:NAD(P)-dependent dehydrogenase (short-subunit alcohol dehydrogenase family)